jgi:large subunit ribosomal protein L25
MATATLRATRREGGGKGASRKLRGTGKIPAVLYGHGDRTETLAVDAHDLEMLLHAIRQNTLIGLEVDGRRTEVLIREVQRHPYRPEVLHVDFLLVHSDEPIKVSVPVVLAGTPVGVHTHGGVLDHVLYELDVECLPADIPETVEVDVSALEVGDSVRVRDLSLPRVTVLTGEDVTIATVLAPTVPEVEEEAAAAEAPEPELVRERKGAEDEE